MKVTGDTLPGYRVYEYMLILNPHEELRERIASLRERFNKDYQVAAGLRATPNLALVNFMQYEMMEERILQKLRLIGLGFPPFKVELKDFGSYPSHTIYLQVTSKLPIEKLVKEVKTETQALMKLNRDTKPHFLQEPHFTIGMKLKPWQYEKAWVEYSHKSFSGRFIADAMLLLKRLPGERWQIAERIELQNMAVPAEATQGSLFM